MRVWRIKEKSPGSEDGSKKLLSSSVKSEDSTPSKKVAVGNLRHEDRVCKISTIADGHQSHAPV
jgi:hypothetical protein